MKANSLVKQEITIGKIHQDIQQSNDEGKNKIFIPHFIPLSDQTKLQLMNDGFKVYMGAWDGFMINCTIIEW